MKKNPQVIVLPKVKCVICGYAWTPRSETLPIACPKCRRADWRTGTGPHSIQAAKAARERSAT